MKNLFIIIAAVTLVVFSVAPPIHRSHAGWVGGKILKEDILSKFTGAKAGTLFTVQTEQMAGSEIVTKKQKFFIAGAVLGICKKGKNILGISGGSVAGHKLVIFGICM